MEEIDVQARLEAQYKEALKLRSKIIVDVSNLKKTQQGKEKKFKKALKTLLKFSDSHLEKSDETDREALAILQKELESEMSADQRLLL
jgi:hypothetical protein